MHLAVRHFMWEQLTVAVPPVIEKNLTGQTVLVTGANVGLGFEAAKHFCRMNADKVIIACRDQQRGYAALQGVSIILFLELRSSTDCTANRHKKGNWARKYRVVDP